MNVILLEPVANIGELGDEVNVKAGFARNYLVPQGKAVRATKANRAEFAARREELEVAANERLAAANKRAEGLAGHVLNIMVKAGEEGKLYGSVGTQDIVDALAADNLEVQCQQDRQCHRLFPTNLWFAAFQRELRHRAADCPQTDRPLLQTISDGWYGKSLLLSPLRQH